MTDLQQPLLARIALQQHRVPTYTPDVPSTDSKPLADPAPHATTQPSSDIQPALPADGKCETDPPSIAVTPPSPTVCHIPQTTVRSGSLMNVFELARDRVTNWLSNVPTGTYHVPQFAASLQLEGEGYVLKYGSASDGAEETEEAAAIAREEAVMRIEKERLAAEKNALSRLHASIRSLIIKKVEVDDEIKRTKEEIDRRDLALNKRTAAVNKRGKELALRKEIARAKEAGSDEKGASESESKTVSVCRL